MYALASVTTINSVRTDHLGRHGFAVVGWVIIAVQHFAKESGFAPTTIATNHSRRRTKGARISSARLQNQMRKGFAHVGDVENWRDGGQTVACCANGSQLRKRGIQHLR